MTMIEFTNTQCRCGCKTVLLGKKSRFAQGHDARFVSQLKQLALDSDKGLHATITLVDRSTDPATQSQESVIETLRQLGSPALVAKLESGFHKELDRNTERAARKTKAALAREDAKGRRTSRTKPTPAEQAATEADPADPVDGIVDLDTLIASVGTGDTPEPAVEGEAPVAFKRAGRVRRGAKEA